MSKNDIVLLGKSVEYILIRKLIKQYASTNRMTILLLNNKKNATLQISEVNYLTPLSITGVAKLLDSPSHFSKFEIFREPQLNSLRKKVCKKKGY